MLKCDSCSVHLFIGIFVSLTILSSGFKCRLKFANVYHGKLSEGASNPSPADRYWTYEQKGVNSMFFHMFWYYPDNTALPFNRRMNDTYSPNIFLWARQQGLNVIHMPVDAGVLSVGLMGISTKHITVMADASSKYCMTTLSQQDYINEIITFIVFQVIHGDLNILMPKTQQKGKDTAVICRAAYAFEHPLWKTRGMGFKCCSYFRSDRMIYCKIETGEYWYLFWLGPLSFLLWIYAIICLHFFKTYRSLRDKRKLKIAKLASAKITAAKETIVKLSSAKSAQERLRLAKTGQDKFLFTATSLAARQAHKGAAAKMTKINLSKALESAETSNVMQDALEKMEQDMEKELKKTVSKVGADITSKLEKSSDKLSMSEQVSIFDLVGVPQSIIKLAKQLITYCFSFSVIIAFYYFHIIMIFTLGDIPLIPLMSSSGEVYLNVFCHLGWLFAPKSTAIYKYAIFEAVLTFLFPFFAFYLYASFKWKLPKAGVKSNSAKSSAGGFLSAIKKTFRQSDSLLTSAAKPDYGSGGSTGEAGAIDVADLGLPLIAALEDGIQGKMAAVVSSPAGRALQAASGTVVAVYVCLLGGPFLAYITFFVSVALFNNVNTFVPWFLPISIFISLMNRTLDKPLQIYCAMRQVMFDAIEERFPELVDTNKVTGDKCVPRSVIDQFMEGRLTKILYTCFMDFLSLSGVTLLLVLVVLAMQFPSDTIAGSTESVLHMELVVFMPYLTKFLSQEATSKDEYSFLKGTIDKQLKAYAKNLNLNVKKLEKPTEAKNTDNESEDSVGSANESEPPDGDQDVDVDLQM